MDLEAGEEDLDTVHRVEFVGQQRLRLAEHPIPLAEPDGWLRGVPEREDDVAATPEAARQGKRRPEAGEPRPKVPFVVGSVHESPEDGWAQAVNLGQLAARVDHADGFVRPAEIAECRALGDQGVGHDRDEVGVFGRLEHRVGDLDRPPVVAGHEPRAGELRAHRDHLRLARQIGELVDRWFENLQSRVGAEDPRELGGERRGRSGVGRPVARCAAKVQGAAQQGLRLVVAACCRRLRSRGLQQIGAFHRIGGDRERLAEEGQRLVVGTQGSRTPRRCPEGDPGLAREGVRLGTFGRVRLGREIVACERSGELVAPQHLEEPGGSEVADLAVRMGQRVVGDLADERLNEAVLAALGGARVGLEREELALDQGAQSWLELLVGNPRNRREPGKREALA